MQIGVPKEIKNHEYRVGLPPAGVVELVKYGHEVLVEMGAGDGAGFDDLAYSAAGATLVDSPSTIFQSADLIVKVKEPQPDECKQLRPGQLLFTYLDLAADRVQTDLLLRSGATCIAYETVEGHNGGLPLLAPMSEIAGRLAAQAGGDFLKKSSGGRGVLLGRFGGLVSTLQSERRVGSAVMRKPQSTRHLQRELSLRRTSCCALQSAIPSHLVSGRLDVSLRHRYFGRESVHCEGALELGG